MPSDCTSFASLSSGLEHSSGSQPLKHPLVAAPIWKVPVSFTPLIGREQEVLSVCAFLKRADVSLVTLLGTGGVGKTRLSIQVATELREHFVDGVCFVPLAAITDDNLVGAAIAKELDIRELGDMPLLEHVQIALRKKHLLLVLDNFEQVVGASLAVEKLLVACPRLKVLVTSRTALHLRAEQEFPLAPLQLPDLRHLPTQEILAQNAAVALFVQRARAILPAFQLLPTNAPIVAEICVRLDGLPLAIELAAARIKLLPPPALLARLSRRLQVLTDGARAIDVRHRTLRATLQWSYDLLDSEEQELFRQLSVFAGGCTLEAVEAVRNAGNETGGHHLPILDGVSSLLDKSLLQVSHEEEEPRILMLETVREYAMERLKEEGEAEVSQRNHAGYYLAFVEKASLSLKGDQQSLWLARVEWEQENLRAALTWLLAQQEAELALRFCAALGWFWYLRGHWREGRHWQVETLKLSQACEPTPARARVLTGAGYLAYRQNDYSAARTELEESVLLCRSLDIERDLALSLFLSGVLIEEQGEQGAARPLLDESLTLCQTFGYTWELAFMLRKLAHLASRQGHLTQAADYAQEALPLAREVGDQFLIATTLCTLGEIAEQQGDLPLASARMEEGFRLASGVGNKALTAVTLQNLGYIASLQGDLMLAAARTEEGLLLAREQGDRTSITLILCTLGEIAWRQGELMRAKTWYQESLSLAQEIGDEALVGWNLVGLAEVAAVEGQPDYAARLFGAAETKLDANVKMDARERADYERMVKSVRTQLGEKAFATTWAEGRTMTPEQLLSAQELATRPEPVSAITQPTTFTRGRPRYPAGLTAREVEVLQLVAQGLTDAQVAEQLVITPRTVNFHLTSIYGKIGVSSRAAATRYAMEQELA